MALFSQASALTVEEIIRLKQPGVSDSTMEMLIKGDGDSRRAGTWTTKDGWIVQSTDTRDDPEYYEDNDSIDAYPTVILPRVFIGRR